MKRVVTFLLAAGLVFAVAAPATAAPPSSDPKTDAVDAAAWLGASGERVRLHPAAGESGRTRTSR